MIYTDGSYETDTHRAGAGVFTLKDGGWDGTTVCPSKPGPVNTINRAELMVELVADIYFMTLSSLVQPRCWCEHSPSLTLMHMFTCMSLTLTFTQQPGF